LLMFGNCGLS